MRLRPYLEWRKFQATAMASTTERTTTVRVVLAGMPGMPRAPPVMGSRYSNSTRTHSPKPRVTIRK